MSAEELKKDLTEVKELLEQATRKRVKDILSVAQHKIETDIIGLEEKERLAQQMEVTASSSAAVDSIKSVSQNERYLVELNEYAWDQSDRYVKIFATLDGVQKLTDTDVYTAFTENTMILTVRNLNNKDYRMVIKNLHSSIVGEKSYQKIKTDMVVVYMKKLKEGEHWSHLTLTEKRLKSMQESAFKGESDSIKDDPTSGMMDLMKKMYQTGDPEMKRMIAKAWTENSQKSQDGKLDMI